MTENVVNLTERRFEKAMNNMPGPHEGYDFEFAMNYLLTGGLGEVTGFTEMYRDMGHPKVQLDTDMAMALCLLAMDGAKYRSLGSRSHELDGM